MHNVAEVLWVELRGEVRGVDQVTKHHGELATFSMWPWSDPHNESLVLRGEDSRDQRGDGPRWLFV
jgi:hypothetical protein